MLLSYLPGLLCKFIFNSFCVLHEIYLSYDYQCYFPIGQTHSLVLSLSPCPSWRSFSELVVFLVLLHNCHPGTGLRCSSVLIHWVPCLLFFFSLFLCFARTFLIAFKKGYTGYNFKNPFKSERFVIYFHTCLIWLGMECWV